MAEGSDRGGRIDYHGALVSQDAEEQRGSDFNDIAIRVFLAAIQHYDPSRPLADQYEAYTVSRSS